TAHALRPEHAERQTAVRCVPRTQRITDPQKEPKMSAWSCDQLCPITADHISATCKCASVPALSAHPCHLPVPISATSMPHISAHLSCLSVSPISASQCHLSMPVSATYQCCQSVPVSGAYQCQSVPPISVHRCHLSVLVSAAYQCHI
ncbi:unnamed protein product, partial [Staurois parvus]